MKLLIELLTIIQEADKTTKVGPTLRSKVYHADYVKTKDEPYRQYTEEGRKKRRKRRKG